MNQALNKNERLLEQVMSKDIVNLIVNSSVDFASVNVHECKKCLKLKTELQKDFVEKDIYDKLFKRFTTLENIAFPQSQAKDMVIKKLKEIIKSLSGNMDKDKIKQDLEEIETINIELDHRETQRKNLANNEVTHHPSDPEINMEPITLKLLNKRSAHTAYIKHTQEEAAVLRDLVDHIHANYPLDPTLEFSRVKPSTSASEPQPSGNTKKDMILQTQGSTQKNKVEVHPRQVKSSLKNKDHVVAPKGTAHV
ncbi:hypothetical protein Tco_0711195 [Tanacetum coccineum]